MLTEPNGEDAGHQGGETVDDVGPSAVDDGGVRGDAQCLGSSHPFFELARQASGQSPILLTAAEAVERTDIIALGRLSTVNQGHTVDYREGASNPTDTVVMVFEIDETIKGPDTRTQYVEYVSGAFEASQFVATLPVEMPMMLFLRETTKWSESTYVITNEGAGVPEGEVLRSFFPLIQVVIDCRGQLEYPMGDETGGELFSSQTLSELEDEVRN